VTRFLAIGLLILAAFPLGCSSKYADTVEGSIPDLIEYLKQGDEPTRAAAAQALAEKGVEARSAVPALADALRDEYELVRQRAAEALAAIGPEAKAAVPALLMALRDGVPQVREAVQAALRSIDPVAPLGTGLETQPR
jgi:HEAT repeat protein